MKKICFMLSLVIFFCGCFAYVEHKEGVSRIKTFGITDEEALDLLDKAEAKRP